MDNYGLYKKSRNAAWQTLIDFKIRKLPISTARICIKANFKLIPFDKAKEIFKDTSTLERIQDNSGATYNINGQWYILYNGTQSTARIRFTVAHELGHIFLGHTVKSTGAITLFRSSSNTGDYNLQPRDPDERAADIFASRLLAPLCVLNEIDADTPELIARVCQISPQAARYRAERLALVRPRDMFKKHPLERRVHAQFQEFIIKCNE